MARAKRATKKGCEAYLACVIDTQEKERKLEDMSVVYKFPDVFRNNLPRPSPNKEIEFETNFLQGTTPISKVPYRMALTKLKELNV